VIEFCPVDGGEEGVVGDGGFQDGGGPAVSQPFLGISGQKLVSISRMDITDMVDGTWFQSGQCPGLPLG
jgi:hypothetical protein